MRLSWKQAVAAGAAWALVIGPSCGSDLEQPSEVTSLRILAVTADQPYVEPGEEVTLRMTYHDGLGPSPRPIQITWIAGCVAPPGFPYFGCYPQLAEQFAALGGSAPSGPLLQQEVAAPELSGAPDGVSFSAPVPKELGGKPGDTAPDTDSLVAYVFFTACAGTVRPEAPDSEAEFPLGCFDEHGGRVGPDGFVIGFTEIFVFAEDRPNENPGIGNITLDETPLADSPGEAPMVPPCEGANEAEGCGGKPSCGHQLEAMVADVAEDDPAGTATAGRPQREVVWVNYYADGGTLETSEELVSDADTGYRESHDTTWTPPETPGLVTIWAVAHDNRGGASVSRRYIRVE
jgi:hypothetical protein